MDNLDLLIEQKMLQFLQIQNSGGGIMTRIKTSIALMAVAAGLAACGSTATVSPKTPTTAVKQVAVGPTTAPTVDCGAPNQPPKNMPPQPVSDNCWAGGFYLGTGSFHNRKIIYADKFANYTLDQITPQLIRTNPKLAQTILKASTQVIPVPMANKLYNGTVPNASAGDSQVTTGKNPSDPLGLLYNYPTIVSGGVSAFAKSGSSFKDPTTALVTECVDNQEYWVGPSGAPLSGLNGYTGYLQWTDQLVRTSSGWQMSLLGINQKEVKSCGG